MSVRVVLAVRPENGVPVLDMRGELTVFQDLDNPNRWQGPFRGSPTRWKAADGEAVVRALHEAQANPVARPLGRLARIRRKPAVVPGSADGGVSVPEDDEPAGGETPEAAVSAHAEIQHLLVKLGAEMSFDVHVARNDQSRVAKGQRLGRHAPP